MRSTRAPGPLALLCLAALGAGCRFGYDPLAAADDGGAESDGGPDGGPDATPGPDAAGGADAPLADAGPPDASCDPTALLADGFATMDPRWASFGAASGATPALVNGRLRVTLPTSGVSQAFGGFVTIGHYSLTGKRLSVEVPTMVNTSTHAQAIMQVDVNVGGASYAAGFEQQNGSMHVFIHGPGLPVDQFFAYSAIAHRFWQVRESGGALFFETSPDGATWNPILSSVSPFAVSSLKIELSAGIYQPEILPGMAEFDNLGGTVELGTACKAR